MKRERCWKIITTRRQNMVADVKYTYPEDGVWTAHMPSSKRVLCESGYHYCKGRQVLDWLPSTDTALLAEVQPCRKHGSKHGDNKSVTCSLRIVRTFPLTARILRLFACDCAERALTREREQGREPDPRSWDAVKVARRHATGHATEAQLAAAGAAAGAAAWNAARAAAWDAARAAAGDAARAAAGDAAWDAAGAAGAAAWDAAWDAAREAAGAAAWAAARYAARAAEREWQYHKLLELAGAE